MKIKMIVTDLEGTFLYSDETLPKESKEDALAEVAKYFGVGFKDIISFGDNVIRDSHLRK